MGPKTTPSLISKGGYQITPPSVGENGPPLGNRVKWFINLSLSATVTLKISTLHALV